MKQSDGHINVYSETGVGTTFRLYLPRAMSGTPKPQSADGAGDVLAGRSRDDPRGRGQSRAARARWCASSTQLRLSTAFEAENGPSALKMLETHDVDLLFTDVIMPGGLSGYELGRARARRAGPRIKVLLTSGFPEEKINGNGKPPWNMRLLAQALPQGRSGADAARSAGGRHGLTPESSRRGLPVQAGWSPLRQTAGGGQMADKKSGGASSPRPISA